MALTTNLVAYWKFDENTGTSAADATGNGNTGTLVGSPSWVAGKINSAVSYNGTSQYTQTGSGSSYAGLFPSAISMCAWVSYPNFSNYQRTLTLETNSTDYNVWLQANKTSATVQFGAGGSSYKTGTTALSTNTWYFICGVTDYTQAGTHIYVNGVDDGGTFTGTPSYNATNAYLDVGALLSTGTRYYGAATIDEVGVWSRALTSTEVTQLYNSGAGLQYPFVASTSNAPFFLRMVTQ